MASELRVNTLKDASGNNSIATSFVAGGSAKAYTTFNAESSNASYISLNQSSLSDIAVGQHALNFTTNMNSGNYFCFGSVGDTGSTTGQRIIGVGDATAPTSSKVTFDAIDVGGSLDDQDHHNFGVMGTLA